MTVFDTSNATRADCRIGHLCEVMLFSFVVEEMGLPDVEDCLSIGHVVSKL